MAHSIIDEAKRLGFLGRKPSRVLSAGTAAALPFLCRIRHSFRCDQQRCDSDLCYEACRRCGLRLVSFLGAELTVELFERIDFPWLGTTRWEIARFITLARLGYTEDARGRVRIR